MTEPSLTDAPLISIRNATIWRGSTCVFQNLDLEIEQHERVAILGPNGSGKTTLLKAINREVYPVHSAETSFRILGRERWNVWDLRTRIGLVSHDLQQRYTPTTSALEVVVSGFFSSIGVQGMLQQRVSQQQKEMAKELLREMGLAELADRELAHLSTGQQRRCLLARALVHNPEALILDEPTAGLDLAACFGYLALIRQLANAGRNIILVTHHIGEIPPEVERVVVLREGRVVADGPKADVLDSEFLSQVYATPIRIHAVDGYYLAYPGS
ncbi:MAG TPA: ATP-binding cassette domain-containing protein [Woeseiaceae bacterium]|nr:ATP-binding cassette domain-containing protein [Woeseiaceae bacterium]